MKKGRVVIPGGLLALAVLGYVMWWFLKPLPIPEPAHTESGVLQLFQDDPDIVAIIWVADGRRVFTKMNETLAPPITLSFFEKLFLGYLKNAWIIVRRSKIFFPGWTWVATLPVPEALPRIIETFGKKLPPGLSLQKKKSGPMCQSSFYIKGFHHAWGNSLEFDFCSGRMIVSPELYSWQDMRKTLVRSDFYPVPPAYAQGKPFVLFWFRPGKVHSEMFSPLLKAYTARFYSLYSRIVDPEALVHGKVFESNPQTVRIEMDVKWPPLHLPKEKLLRFQR